jgi:DNA-directed RNA polymerase subunit RPC12/RpoP
MSLTFNIDFKVKDSSKSTIISSGNIKDEIVKILSSTHKESQKHDIDDRTEGRLKIACPYCGDSQKFLSKKRGIMYLDTQTYKCWNCGKWKPLKYFFEDFDSDIADGLDDFVFDTYIQESTSVEMSILDIYDIKDKLYDRKTLMFKMGLVEPIDKHQIYEYLLERKQNPEDKKFAVNPRTKDIIIFNISNNNKVIGLQIRKHVHDPSRPRFISFPFGDIKKKILKEELSEREEKEAERIKRISLIDNILKVDLSKEINIFESSMNASLLKNSIAIWGADSNLRLDNASYFFDDDVAGRKKAVKMLMEGRKTFLWKKFRKTYKMFSDERRFNDFNDLHKAGYDGKDIFEFMGRTKLDMAVL